MNDILQSVGGGSNLGIISGFFVFIILLMIWSIIWKGLALWHSAQRKQGWWFVIFMILNTAGILEIIYLFLVAKVPGSELFGSKKEVKE